MDVPWASRQEMTSLISAELEHRYSTLEHLKDWGIQQEFLMKIFCIGSIIELRFSIVLTLS
jgi:hypothetical protein